jgi:hypothetical protein
MDDTIDSIIAAFCDEMATTHKWFLAIKFGAMIVAANNFPLSGCLPAVQAMRNGLNNVLDQSYGGRGL